MSGLSDDAIYAYAANISDLEDAREKAQTDLKEAWTHIREAYGKRFANSLKLAVKRQRMDQDKRQEADEIDAEAERILSVLNAGPRVRVARGAREELPEHDADGVIIEDKAETPNEAALAPVAARQAGEEVRASSAANSEPQPKAAQTGGVPPAPPSVAGPEAVESPAPHSEPREGAPVGRSGDSEPPAHDPAPVDRSKPAPWCQDPDDCRDASWTHPCGSCLRRRAQAEAAGALQ